MYSQNRFYASSVGLINREKVTLHNKKSIVIYTGIFLLVTSKTC